MRLMHVLIIYWIVDIYEQLSLACATITQTVYLLNIESQVFTSKNINFLKFTAELYSSNGSNYY